MTAMRPRRAAAWLLSLPLMIAGTQVAHVLAYRFVYPNAHIRLTELLATGHSYMIGTHGYVPMLLGMAGAVDLVSAGWVFAGSLRRNLQRPVPAWAFALMPILCFTLQEFLERWLAGAPFPWWILVQPTFRIGLLLQLPFALLAFLAARLLLRAAEAAGQGLRQRAPRPVRFGFSVGWVALARSLWRRPAPATVHAGRGPPPAPAAVITAHC
jgi:hypothetical protein